MKNNSNKTKAIRLGAFALCAGIGLSNIGCKGTNIDDLFFTVKGKDLEVVFCDRGASIYSIKYNGTTVTYHPKDKSTFLRDDYYYGKALGRVAGRIKDGKFKIDDKEYDVGVNETDAYYKHNNLHGGKDGINTKDFKRYIKETDDATIVTFTYLSPANEGGFPGELYCIYQYTVSKKEDTIKLNITGTPSERTLINLSNHPYFRLADDGDILEHKLTLKNSTHLAEFKMNDDKRTDQIVTGKIPLDNQNVSEWDFRNGKTIGLDIEKAKEKDLTSGGYDHIWYWDNSDDVDVILENPKNKIKLEVVSDSSNACIMYANCYPHENDEMNPSGKDALYAGITIEPIDFWTEETIEDIVWGPEDDPFTRSITYTFSKAE